MRVALVHDYLTQYGGAERVLDVIHDQFPDAPVYTSLYAPDQMPDHYRDWDIRTSPLAHVPGAVKSHRLWLPIYPTLFRQLGHRIDDVDVVIADSSAWSHQAHPANGIPSICYCHTPARFLYKDRDYLGATTAQSIARPLLDAAFGTFRRLDRQAAQRVTHYIANSHAVAQRIATAYRRTADVIYPPIATERFRPQEPVEPEDWFLVVSRLVPHKWIGRAVAACTEANVRLKIIGDGRGREELMKHAGPTIEFLGAQSDEVVIDHLQRCRAMILPGIEDFGMTAVEAQAAGRPVIAARGGGALDSVVEHETGLFFDPHVPGDLARAIRATQTHPWDSTRIMQHAEQFNRARFDRELRAVVDEVVATHPH